MAAYHVLGVTVMALLRLTAATSERRHMPLAEAASAAASKQVREVRIKIGG
jgi:hypothetical protein